MKTEQEIREHLLEKAEADEAFRAQLVADPRATVEQEFNVTVPEGFSLHVHEDTERSAHLVLPPQAGSLNAAELQAVSGGGDGSNTSINPWR